MQLASVLIASLVAGFAGGTLAIWLPVHSMRAIGLAQLVDSQPPGVVRARRFIVVDRRGEDRGELGITEKGTVELTLRSPTGSSLIDVVSERNGAQLRVAAGSETAALGIDALAGTNLNLTDSHGKLLVHLRWDEHENPRLTLVGPDSKPVGAWP